jgi:prolyl-tRNA synthetase
VQRTSGAKHKAQLRAESPRDAEEMHQLVEAERLLAAEPVRALRIVREGHVKFRGGYFAQERRYIEVMALFALGRRGEAHAQATWFLRDYPSGPYRHRVESEMLRLPAR